MLARRTVLRFRISSYPSPLHIRLSSSSTPKSYYELFPNSVPAGPPPDGPFHVDSTVLRREFFQLQQSAHPDVAHKATASTPSSAFINNAYRTLLDPLSRAQYLLAQRDIDVTEDETMQVEDQSLLLEVMEAQEEIENAKTEEDLVAVKLHNDERIERCVDILGKAFAEDDLRTAKRETVNLRYWRNIKHTLDHWEPGKPIEFAH